MKVVRPEWLVESAKSGVLLPWKEFIFRPGGRVEDTQGRKNAQTSLQGFATQKLINTPTTSLDDTLSPDDSAPVPVVHEAKTTEASVLPRTPTKQGFKPHSPRTPTSAQAHNSTDPVSPAEAARIPDYASRKSNVHAARAMADPAWRAAHTSVAPDFIEGYYRNSRLHHLSTWKTELRSLVTEAQERAERGDVPVTTASQALAKTKGVSMKGAELVLKSPLKGKGKETVDKDKEKVIMHVDFDAFFVSAGLVARPELKGKPVVVCHSQGAQGGASSTSEIASASYEARAFGIKNGMR